jgi:RNA polymerase sigma factor (sigma-70 family)
MFQEAFVQLTELQKRVIVESVLEGATENDIAQKIGITHQAVSRLKKRGLKKLKKYFVPDNPNRQEEKYPGRKIPSTEA